MDRSSRYRGALLGMAVGDALGVSAQYERYGHFDRIIGMRGGGPFGLAAGQWSDETSVALCVAESIADNDDLDPEDVMRVIHRWWRNGYWSSTGIGFDACPAIEYTLQQFEATGEIANRRDGVASEFHDADRLAWVVPVVVAHARHTERAIERSAELSDLTFGSRIARDATRYFAAMLSGAFAGAAKTDLMRPMYTPIPNQWDRQPLQPEIVEIAQGAGRPREEVPRVSSDANAECVLEAVIWALCRASDFREGLLDVVNLGGASDTAGALYGALAGALFGVDGIPTGWIAQVSYRDEIDELASRLQPAPKYGSIHPLTTDGHPIEPSDTERQGGDWTPQALQALTLHPNPETRLFAAEHPDTPSAAVVDLLDDPDLDVYRAAITRLSRSESRADRWAVARHERTERALLMDLSHDPAPEVVEAALVSRELLDRRVREALLASFDFGEEPDEPNNLGRESSDYGWEEKTSRPGATIDSGIAPTPDRPYGVGDSPSLNETQAESSRAEPEPLAASVDGSDYPTEDKDPLDAVAEEPTDPLRANAPLDGTPYESETWTPSDDFDARSIADEEDLSADLDLLDDVDALRVGAEEVDQGPTGPHGALSTDNDEVEDHSNGHGTLWSYLDEVLRGEEHSQDETWLVGADAPDDESQIDYEIEQESLEHRAERLAADLMSRHGWTEGRGILTSALLRRHLGGRVRAIHRHMENGMQPDELELVLQLREYWQARFQGRGYGLTWNDALAFIRGFDGYPQYEEMIEVLLCLHACWRRSPSRYRFKTFSSYVWHILADIMDGARNPFRVVEFRMNGWCP